MNKLILFGVFLTLTACSGSGDSSSDASSDTMLGDWYYQAPGSSSVETRGIIAKIESEKFFIASLYAYRDGNSVVFYYRKSEGTYTKNGKQIDIKYTYETCNPVGSETVEITAEKDKLIVYDPKTGISLQMLRSNKEGVTANSIISKEDRDCTILSKITAQESKTGKRSVANDNNIKSILQFR